MEGQRHLTTFGFSKRVCCVMTHGHACANACLHLRSDEARASVPIPTIVPSPSPTISTTSIPWEVRKSNSIPTSPTKNNGRGVAPPLSPPHFPFSQSQPPPPSLSHTHPIPAAPPFFFPFPFPFPNPPNHTILPSFQPPRSSKPPAPSQLHPSPSPPPPNSLTSHGS